MSSTRELQCLNTLAYMKFVRVAPLTELIGINENVVAGNHSKSVAFTIKSGLPLPLLSGKIIAVKLKSSESGTGSILTPKGVLYFFNADPAISTNASALTATADHDKKIGVVPINVADWKTDTVGATAHALVEVFFKDINKIYATFKLDATATDYNSLGTDDELLELSFDFHAYPQRLSE